jgi:hypothetical protein
MEIKMKVMALIVGLVVVLLLGGCYATTSDIRRVNPSFTFTSIKPPNEMAKCIYSRSRTEIDANTTMTTILDEYPTQKIYHVSLTSPHWGYPNCLADVLVKPSGNGSVVEFRHELWATWLTYAKIFLEIVRQCTRQKMEHNMTITALKVMEEESPGRAESSICGTEAGGSALGLFYGHGPGGLKNVNLS